MLRRLALVALVAAAATALPWSGVHYTLDKSWQPHFPEGGHTYSGVGVGHPGWGGSSKNSNDEDETLIFITQRGNSSVAPVLVFNEKGENVASWGKNAVGLDGSKALLDSCALSRWSSGSSDA